VFANNDVFTSGAAAISGNCTVATGNNGNISSDPLFVDPAVNNFHLQTTSPAIDAGNNTARIALPATDLEGNPRVFNGTVDMGALEFQGATTTTFSATSLTFPATEVGATSSQSVTISNTGSVALQIIPFNISGDFTETDNCHTSAGIAPGQSCTINVSFAPTATGTRTGQLAVTCNDAASPTTISLSGAALPREVTLSTHSLFFGSQPLTTTSNAQAVTLTVTGINPLTIASIAISGDFAQTNTCGTFLPSGSCTISAAFTPTALGLRSGTITITDSGGDSPQVVTLAGVGTSAVTFSTNFLSFPGQTVGATSVAQSVTLTNNGSVAVNVTGITLSGSNSGDFSQTNNCAPSVAAGANCVIRVIFTPTAIGRRSASMTITDDAVGGSRVVHLAGTGVAAIASPSPR
jgi:hypothetical protein